MNIFIVYAGWDYENSEWIGAFTTKEKAEAALKDFLIKESFEDTESLREYRGIQELELK